MQPTLRTDNSSLPARTALLALAADLQLHPVVLTRALEYALDHLSSFPSAAEAVCFGVVRQGYCVDMQILSVALLRLRRNFGGMYDFVGQGRTNSLMRHSGSRGCASSKANSGPMVCEAVWPACDVSCQ